MLRRGLTALKHSSLIVCKAVRFTTNAHNLYCLLCARIDGDYYEGTGPIIK